MYSEGCGCCTNTNHSQHANVLAELLDFPKFDDDDSGYDFYTYIERKLFGL